MELKKLLKIVLFTALISCLIWQTQSKTNVFTVGSSTIHAEEIQQIPNAFNQCFVNIAVFNSSSYKYGLSGAKVTVLSRIQTTPPSTPPGYDYKGFSEGTTDSTGRLCLLVYCFTEGIIFVEKNLVRIFASSETNQKLPTHFYVNVMNSNEIIQFHSYVWGTVNGHTGPVYSSSQKDKCQRATSDDYHFVFSYISIPDQLVSTPVPFNSTVPFHSTAWRYVLSPRTCYMKMLIKTKSTQLSVRAYSRLNDASGIVLGLYVSGAKYDISSSDFTSKAVCLQFRCPTEDMLSVPMNTHVTGTITDANGVPVCCKNYKETAKNVNYQMNATSFSATFYLGNNYGDEDGVYIDSTTAVARSKCFTGRSGFLGTEYAMDVHSGYAMEYDCTQPCINAVPIG